MPKLPSKTQASQQAYLSLVGVSKTYANGVRALNDFTLGIAAGAFVVVIGPSGCGKSTLLRVIAGLETATQGDIMLDGRRVNAVEAGDRDLAMVFQSYALYPHMSVRDNMVYGLKRRGLSRETINNRIHDAATILRLTELLPRKPAQLSGGQRQRVAMGRAIVRHPKAFLLDEPLSNLDAHLRAHMRGELKNLHQRLATTFLYVTHDQAEAMTLGDRIIVMNQGRIAQHGTPETLYTRPANRFVAGFIGSPGMNIVAVADRGKIASIGFRPESAQIGLANKTSPPDTDTASHFAGRITAIDYLGSDYFVTVALDNTGDTVMVRISQPTRMGINQGDKVVVAVASAALCAFDADGNALPPR